MTFHRFISPPLDAAPSVGTRQRAARQRLCRAPRHRSGLACRRAHVHCHGLISHARTTAHAARVPRYIKGELK
jgi:hypothetical protein